MLGGGSGRVNMCKLLFGCQNVFTETSRENICHRSGTSRNITTFHFPRAKKDLYLNKLTSTIPSR